jgi:hypothetical protein
MNCPLDSKLNRGEIGPLKIEMLILLALWGCLILGVLYLPEIKDCSPHCAEVGQTRTVEIEVSDEQKA